MPDSFGREDGGTYASGTEWEFENAVEAHKKNGVPDLLVYRKTLIATANLDDEDELMQKLAQKRALDGFIERWFGSPDDSFRAAFHAFETPDAFEGMLETHLRKLIANHMPENLVGEDSGTAVTWHTGSPFLGLEAFSYDHAPVFFGRTRAVGEIREALVGQAARGTAFLLVYGMSGSGKSSLVHAGVLPTICQTGVIERVGLWRWCALRPADNSDLFEGLASTLLRDGALPEMGALANATVLAGYLKNSPDEATQPIAKGLDLAGGAAGLRPGAEAKLLLVVDQFEELFTREGIDPELRRAFIRVLSSLARSGRVWVIGTMRSDFYHRVDDEPELLALTEGAGQYRLLPPSAAELAQMIRSPAFAAGLRFEENRDTGERLDDALHAAATRDPAALPLLEFVLDELFKARSDAGVLTYAAYETLGGLEGALARRAEDTFAALPSEVQNALPSMLRALVTVDEGDDAPVSARRAELEDAAATPARKTLIEAFVAARLLVAYRTGNDKAAVRIAHEALITHWPRLQDWLAEDRDFLRTRTRVTQAAERWADDARNSDLLLPEGKPLAEAEEVLGPRRSELDPVVVAFIDHSAARASAIHGRRLRRTRIVAGALALLATIAAGFGWYGYDRSIASEAARKQAVQAGEEAKTARNQAVLTRSRFLADFALQETNGGDVVTGMLLSLEALPDAKSSDEAHRDRPYWPGAEVSLDSARRSMREITVLEGHADGVSSVAVTPDGARIVTGSWDKTARIWDARSGAEIAVLTGHVDGVSSVAGTPDGSRIVTGSWDKTARIWDARSGAEIAVLTGHTGLVKSVAVTPDSARIVTGSVDWTVRIWDAASGAAIAVLKGHTDIVTSVAVTPDGARIVSGSEDKTVRIWDAGSQAEIAVLKGHTDGVSSIAVTPDGARIVTGSFDETARIWDARSGAAIAVLRGHTDSVKSVAVTPDGARIVTGSWDKTARIWDARTGL